VLQDDLLAIALDAAGDAAALIASATARQIDTKSSPTDMVTEVDRASEALITGKIRAARPHDAILGEEGASDTGTSGVRWLVDPLDGTTNFLYRFPAYSVSIAAEVDGVVVAGVVYDVVHNETFTATHGDGAFRDGARLQVAGPSTLATALIGTGFGYGRDLRVRQAAILERLIGSVRDIRRAGSAALDLCWVASGRMDGYYEEGLNAWDWAAGSLIASEAGAFVGKVDTTTVAIVPQLADAFTAAVRAALNDS
jgi:myo-inositol-1(or 4)-monophosphatase